MPLDVGEPPPVRSITDRVREAARRAARANPAVKRSLKEAEYGLGALEHGLGHVLPAVIQPRPRRITIAVTASGNRRCVGIMYL